MPGWILPFPENQYQNLPHCGNAPQKKINDPVLSAIYADLADQMKRIFGTKVEIHQRNDQKGKIEIEYYSQDELNRLIELIQSIQQQ